MREKLARFAYLAPVYQRLMRFGYHELLKSRGMVLSEDHGTNPNNTIRHAIKKQCLGVHLIASQFQAKKQKSPQ